MMWFTFMLLLLGPIVAQEEADDERKMGGSREERKVASATSKRRQMWLRWRSNEELEVRLEVAMCRAHCLPLATTCWSSCETFPGASSRRPGANRPSRGKAGRRLKTRLAFPSQPLLVETLDGKCILTWPALTPIPNSYTSSPSLPRPNVFLVVGSEDNSLGWKELGQTNGLSLHLPPLTADLSLILMAVGKRGIRAKALVKVKAGQCSLQKMEDRPSAPEVLGATKVGAGLVKVELQWSGTEDASYVLRWQAIPNNPITGSLVTSKTKASITLEQDTVYSILMEMITSQGTVAISQPRIIDTRKLLHSNKDILQANPMISGIIEIIDENETKNLFSQQNSILFTILVLFGFLIILAAVCTFLRPSTSTHKPSFDGSFTKSVKPSVSDKTRKELPQKPKMTEMAQLGLAVIKNLLGFLFNRSGPKTTTNA